VEYKNIDSYQIFNGTMPLCGRSHFNAMFYGTLVSEKKSNKQRKFYQCHTVGTETLKKL
jgi:hypothetical protein